MDIILYLLSLFSVVKSASWSYSGATGPTNWGGLDPTKWSLCTNGTKQSPIDIHISTVNYDSDLGSITFTAYNTAPTSMLLKNNGHTLQVDIDGTSTISGGGLETTYKAIQFHLHWGTSNSAGSEHTLDGSAYPAELHIVHMNTSCTMDELSVDPTGCLAVLGFFLQGGGATHQGLQKVLDYLPNITYASENVSLTAFSLSNLIPSNRDKFIRYSGSLTTPGCQEEVVWTVFPDPIAVSDAQLVAMRDTLYENVAGANATIQMSMNYRPVQQLNGRELTSSVDLNTPGGTGSAVNHVISTSLFLYMLLLLVL